MQKKVVYSKVKKNCIFSQKNGFGFKSHNGVFLFAHRSHELGTALLTYASNETKIYRLYLQEHKNKLQFSQT